MKVALLRVKFDHAREKNKEGVLIIRSLSAGAHASPLLLGFMAGCLASVASLRHDLPARAIAEIGGGVGDPPGEIRDAAIEDVDERDRDTIVRARDGLFHATVVANGFVLSCVVDTGASAMILGSDDGRRVGLRPEALRFSGRVQTAGGSRPAAIDRLTMVVAGHRLRDVPVLILQGRLSPCLLGQDVLTRMGSIALRGNSLAFR